MGLFKADLYRFFTLGFAAGALLVVGVMHGPAASDLVAGLVPAAEAAPAR
jgi:hypothetical protein